jgi:hypothetical protein
MNGVKGWLSAYVMVDPDEPGRARPCTKSDFATKARTEGMIKTALSSFSGVSRTHFLVATADPFSSMTGIKCKLHVEDEIKICIGQYHMTNTCHTINIVR